MRAKTKRQEAITRVTSAMMDRWKADQFTTRLRADPFMGIFLQLGDIYADLGEPFVIVNPTTQVRELNMCLVREPQTKKKQRVQPPFLAMDQSAFIQGRQRAEAATQRIVESWVKAGIPSVDVWTHLDKISPGKKRFLAQLALDHGRIVASVEAQRNVCVQLTHLFARDNAFIVFPSDFRSQIASTALIAIGTCAEALGKLAKAGKIIEKAKQTFVHVRNRMRGDAELGLMRLREQHVNERKAHRARVTVILLKAFDPETQWKPESIRAGRAYR